MWRSRWSDGTVPFEPERIEELFWLLLTSHHRAASRWRADFPEGSSTPSPTVSSVPPEPMLSMRPSSLRCLQWPPTKICFEQRRRFDTPPSAYA